MSPQPAKGKGGGLKAKHAGVPLWGWLGIGVVGVAVFLYMRRRSALSAGTSTPAPAATDTLPSDLNAPALGGTPAGSSLPDSGSGGAIPDQKLADAIQNAIAQAYHQTIDSLNAGGVLDAGVGPGSTGDQGSAGTNTGAATHPDAAAAGPSGFWWGGKFYGAGGLGLAAFKKSEQAHGGHVNQVFLAQHPAIEKAFHLPVLPPPPHQAPRAAKRPRAPVRHGGAKRPPRHGG